MIGLGVVVSVVALTGAPDPRPLLVELSRAGNLKAALELTESSIAADAGRSRAFGLDFLRAHLLETLGRPREATEGFAQALTEDRPLASWARLRLAQAQERLGHPEVAAGLTATLLARDPPEALVRPALDLLSRTLERGGDCRLLGGLPKERFTGEGRRLRDLLELKCLLRRAAPGAPTALRAFLSQERGDAPAWEAVSAFGTQLDLGSDRTFQQLIGLTAFAHREFDTAMRLLSGAAVGVSRGPFDTLGQESAYASARSAFWLGRHREAAERFEAIWARAFTPSARADVLFQKGRALELAADPEAAHAAFLRAYHEELKGSWAAPALVSILRLELLAGDEAAARRRLNTLAGTPDFATQTARAALFVALSDLVRGRSGRAATLLALAERTGQASAAEIGYWRGRQAELAGEPERALDQYLTIADRWPFHPLALASRRRLAAPAMANAVRRRFESVRGALGDAELRAAVWLAPTPSERLALRSRALHALSAEASTDAWVRARPLPVSEWSLWKSALDRPDELLLALGLADQGPTAVARHFPASLPRAAFTGAQLLADGPMARKAISLAEAAFDRRPAQVPIDWVARDWLATLYPLPWAELVRGQARNHGVDAALLAAIIREESRFDAAAVSPASARGLTQFVLPTARQLAAAAGLRDVSARDLLDPMVSIPLGAAYLAELGRRFRNDEVSMVAAYNAGEEQVALWRRYCLSGEPEELLGKIGFGETRAYITRVLESRAAYQAVWGLGRLEETPRPLPTP